MRYRCEIRHDNGEKENIYLNADTLEIAIRTVQRDYMAFSEASFYEEQFGIHESGSWKFVRNATPLTVSEDDFDEWATVEDVESFDISHDISLKEDKKDTPLRYITKILLGITKILLGIFLGFLLLYLFFVAAYIGAGKYVVILILIFGILYLIRGNIKGSALNGIKIRGF